jgi:hypothetical protein
MSISTSLPGARTLPGFRWRRSTSPPEPAPPGTPTAGQTLYVTEGVGRIQTRGEEIHEIRPGDIVYTPSAEEHWHGAAPDHFMTHLSMTENVPDQPDTWGDHVTDADYDPTAG